MLNITNILLSTYFAFGQPDAREWNIERYGGVQAVHADGTVTLRMAETGRRETVEGTARHIVLESRDETYPFFVTRHVVIWNDTDVAETWVEIRHDEEGPVRLLKMDSLAAEIPWRGRVKVLTLAGAVQEEAKVVECDLPEGQTLATTSREGIHNAWESNPVMMVSLGDSTERTGDVLGVALEWTGCSAKSVRREYNGRTKVFIGVDNPTGPYVLDPGETLTTPRAMLVLSRKGKGEVTRQFHRWAHRHLMPHGDELHPVLLNSWEGSYFSFTEKTLTDMMDGVREMGGEMFVLDDGWFGRGARARDEVNKDTAGLGDWMVNEKKLPHGLGWLSDQAKARGLKFGLWVEPEMVNTNSELYLAHPDWMMQEPRRRTLFGRGKTQNSLDLCNPKVRDFLFGTIDATYSTIPDLAYVKWDANGPISNPGSTYLPRDRQANLWFDYTKGLYDLLVRFQTKRPHVMTQACASGGGHMDFGFLRYADEFWTSDRTDPLSRVFIQWGALHFYPASAMACHVTASPNHQTKRETPLKYRFDVAMSGRLGFELHPKDLTPEELAYAKGRVAQYKRIRPIVQQGDLYRLASPYENPYAALMYVGDGRKAAVAFVLGLDRDADVTAAVKLDGLDPESLYAVGRHGVRSGRDLMERGLAVEMKGRYRSEVIELAAVDKGALVLTFDDRNFDSWRKALPVFDRFGAHATFFINGKIDAEAIAMMKELRAHGHSLGFHGASHGRAPELLGKKGAEEYVRSELLPQIEPAKAAGLDVSNWGYPFSACNAETEAVLSRHFTRRRTGAVFGRDPAKTPLAACEELYLPRAKAADAALLKATGIGSNFGGLDEDVRRAIGRLAERDEVLVLYSHRIRFDGSRSAHDVSIGTLRATLEEAFVRGVRVIGFDELGETGNPNTTTGGNE